jgi:tetratricopeptide (TPR) repeat protein
LVKTKVTQMLDKPFDLSKIDYESQRISKRRSLLLWSIPAVVLVFFAAVWFLLPALLTQQSITAYKAKDYKTSKSWLGPLTLSSPQPFIIAFNSGTVDTQLGNYDRAETELTRAIALAPANKKCLTLQNYVFSLRAHSASLLKQSDQYNANIYYTKATTTIAANKACFKGAAGGGGGGGGASQSSQNTQSPTPNQLQQLQQKETQGSQRQAKNAQDQSINPNDPLVKRW